MIFSINSSDEILQKSALGSDSIHEMNSSTVHSTPSETSEDLPISPFILYDGKIKLIFPPDSKELTIF